MKECWRDITDYEGMYQISNSGNVRGLDRTIVTRLGVKQKIKGMVMKQALNHKGYPIIYLSAKNKCKTMSVHRIVAKAFIDNSNKYPEVNHIDGNKENNNVENLEWCTPSQNCLHAHATGLRTSKHMKRLRKLTFPQVEMMREMWTHSLNTQCTQKRGKPFSQRWLGKCFGIDKQTVEAIVTYKTYKES